MLELSMSGAVTSGNLDDALREICTAAAHALDVEPPTSGSSIRAEAGYGSHRGRRGCDGAACELSIEDNPPYFAALRPAGIIAADGRPRDHAPSGSRRAICSRMASRRCSTRPSACTAGCSA